MIQVQTMLRVTDNSGAKKAMCIKVIGGSKRKYARAGDIVIVTIKEADAGGVVKKKTVQRAVIVRTTSSIRREDGSALKFDDNAVVIVNADGQPRGTRVFGPVARELRDRGYQKIVSLAPDVV